MKIVIWGDVVENRDFINGKVVSHGQYFFHGDMLMKIVIL